MAIGPVTIVDTFSRSVAAGSGWGTADSGHFWGNTHADNFVQSGSGRRFVQASASGTVVYANITDELTQEVLVRLKYDSAVATDFGPALRRDTNGRYYCVRINHALNQVILALNDGGLINVTTATPSFTLTAGTHYWVRLINPSGNRLQVRIWADGTVEPGTFLIDTTPATGTQPGSGDPGMFWRGTASAYTVFVETFYGYTREETQPALPVTEEFERYVQAGWGRASTGHVWEGTVADDPTFYVRKNEGSVSSNGWSELTTVSSTAVSLGFLGQSSSRQDILGLAEFTNGGNWAVGARGTLSASSGIAQYTGYIARLTVGSPTFSLLKSATAGGSLGTLATFTLSESVANDDSWYIRVRATGDQIRARAWKQGTTEPTDWLVAAQDAGFASGSAFIRTVGAASVTTTFRLGSLVYTAFGSTNTPTPGPSAITSATETSLSFIFRYSNDDNNDVGALISYRVLGSPTWIGLDAANFTVDHAYQKVTGTIPGLQAGTPYEVECTLSDFDIPSGEIDVVIQGTTVGNGVKPNVVTLTAGINQAIAVASYTLDDNSNSTATFEYRQQGTAPWVASAGTVTVDRAQRTFTKTITGLLDDTIYEVRATFADANTVYGTNPISAFVTTMGKAILPLAISVTAEEKQALVTVTYGLDTNENSSLAIQYKDTRTGVWQTIPSSAIGLSRPSKTFFVTLSGLRASASYHVIATLTDPDGLIPGTVAILETSFTTQGQVGNNAEIQGKTYLYKIYNTDDEFIGTWPDAGIPEFGYDENGGCSDLTVRLPRRLHELNRGGKTIAFLNRVDVWVYDQTGIGMGPNLCTDADMDLGSWALTAPEWDVLDDGGPDGSSAIHFDSNVATTRTARSPYIEVAYSVPFVTTLMLKTHGAQAKLYIEAYQGAKGAEVQIDQSEEFTVSIGPDWQTLRLEYIPPANADWLRVCVENIGAGKIWADKCSVLQREMLIYRGRIEEYHPKITQTEQSVEIQVLGLVSLLSDMYVDFLQYAWLQPTRDQSAKRPRLDPKDPAGLLKDLITWGQQNNPHFKLYYTTDSIKNTGTVVEYTFRDRQMRGCFDKVRDLCPPGWHYFIEPDGKVWLRGPEHVNKHVLWIERELLEMDYARSVRNLKNVVHVKGRQDEDGTENDGYGSINFVARDNDSIDEYGIRQLNIRDAALKDPQSAEIMAEGRLDERNRIEERGYLMIPDEKVLEPLPSTALRGYNIESFKPGDFVTVRDPYSWGGTTHWDAFNWDQDYWDGGEFNELPFEVPIKTIQYHGHSAQLEISERQPSATGDFARLFNWLRSQNSDTDD